MSTPAGLKAAEKLIDLLAEQLEALPPEEGRLCVLGLVTAVVRDFAYAAVIADVSTAKGHKMRRDFLEAVAIGWEVGLYQGGKLDPNAADA